MDADSDVRGSNARDDVQAAVEVAQVFATVARDLAQQPDRHAVGHRIGDVVSRVVGCPWAIVIHVTDRGSLSFPAPDDEVLSAVMRIASETTDAIASETATGGQTIVVDDMRAERRFPEYAGRIAAETPVRSAMTVLLKVDDTDLGVLGMYAPQPGFFDERAIEVGSILAEHASVALARASQAERAQNLEIALMTNRKIGMAIGVLMGRLSITDEEAFDLLRRTSQRMHQKLRDVAEYVNFAGDLPPDGTELPKAVSDERLLG